MINEAESDGIGNALVEEKGGRKKGVQFLVPWRIAAPSRWTCHSLRPSSDMIGVPSANTISPVTEV